MRRLQVRPGVLGAAVAWVLVAGAPPLGPPSLAVHTGGGVAADGARVPTMRLEAGTATVRARVEITPATPVVGERVRVRFTATDRAGRDLGGRIDFGRDTEVEPTSSAGCPLDMGGLDDVTHLSHTDEYEFHAPGHHALKAYVTFRHCPGDGFLEFLALPGRIDVLPGGGTPNVGHSPTTEVSVSSRPQGTWYGREVSVSVDDYDGFVDSVEVDLGDGTAPKTSTGNRQGCRDRPAQQTDFRPGARMGFLHYFSGPGTFRIRVSATTTSCDGRHPQTVTTAHPFTIQSDPFR